MPAIGEITVVEDSTYGTSTDAAATIDNKPGMKVTVEVSVGVATSTSAAATEGWANIKDRQKTFTPFVRTWDEWDQVLLKNSKRRIKKLFRPHYNSRDFDTDTGRDKSESGANIVLNGLREALKPPPGQHLLPRWKRRMNRSNPFNSKGELCEKED